MSTHAKYGGNSSNYRQLKLQITHESGGRLSFRLYAKGLRDTWAERHLLVMGSRPATGPIANSDDAIREVVDLLQMAILDRHTVE